MPFPTRLAGFPVNRMHIFYLDGRRYQVGVAGVHAVCLALKIRERAKHHQSLIPLRDEIRTVRRSKCRATLAYLIEFALDSQLQLIAIWLRGLCGGYVGTSAIAKYADAPNERVRAAVAGALQRLSAWALLETMSTNDQADHVRRIAAQRRRRQFNARLRRFTGNVRTIPCDYSPRQLYESRAVDVYSVHPPKPVTWIRQILERIRRLVHGSPDE